MNPVTLSALLTNDRLAGMQIAITSTIDALIEGVRVVAHPGKVDISELLQKTIVTAPGIGIGWSRIRRAALTDGSYSLLVDWTAYIVAEAAVVGLRRVEKEQVGLALGSRVLAILADQSASFWGLTGILPPEESPAPELKPMFTVKDMQQGTAYYAVTWSQAVADLGEGFLPRVAGSAYPDEGVIGFGSQDELNALLGWIPGREVEPDA